MPESRSLYWIKCILFLFLESTSVTMSTGVIEDRLFLFDVFARSEFIYHFNICSFVFVAKILIKDADQFVL